MFFTCRGKWVLSSTEEILGLFLNLLGLTPLSRGAGAAVHSLLRFYDEIASWCLKFRQSWGGADSFLMKIILFWSMILTFIFKFSFVIESEFLGEMFRDNSRTSIYIFLLSTYYKYCRFFSVIENSLKLTRGFLAFNFVSVNFCYF